MTEESRFPWAPQVIYNNASQPKLKQNKKRCPRSKKIYNNRSINTLRKQYKEMSL